MNSTVSLSLIVARARNGVIGNNGDLPWRLSNDLKMFKARTTGHPILMGRKTWDSLPRKPLPGRDNIILTRDWTVQAPGARIYTSTDAAIASAKALARQAGQTEVFIIGGAMLYRETAPQADTFYVTEVDAEVEGDVKFPAFDERAFDVSVLAEVKADDKNDFDFTVRKFSRRR